MENDKKRCPSLCQIIYENYDQSVVSWYWWLYRDLISTLTSWIKAWHVVFLLILNFALNHCWHLFLFKVKSPHASPFRLEIRAKTLISRPSRRFSLQTFEIRLCSKDFITTNLTYLFQKLKNCQITWHPDRFKSLQSWFVDLL